MAIVEQQPNPLVEGLERLPAVYNLAHEGALPERFNLIAISRSDIPHDDYRQMARESIAQHSRRQPDGQVLDKLLERVRYVPGTFDDDSIYERLGGELREFDDEAGIPFNRVFYLSTAPEYFPVIIGKLGEHGLGRHEGSEVRGVIEKPFGTRLHEALDLMRFGHS